MSLIYTFQEFSNFLLRFLVAQVHNLKNLKEYFTLLNQQNFLNHQKVFLKPKVIPVVRMNLKLYCEVALLMSLILEVSS